MEKGMNVEIVEKFSEQRLEVEQQKILDILANDAMTYEQDGVQITLATASFAEIHSGLALVTEKLLDMKGTDAAVVVVGDRKSTRLNSSHVAISYAVFCLKKKNNKR